jgi:signal transduction histidine kinase
MEQQPLRILCLEDDPEDFEFVNEVLARNGVSFVSTRVHTEDAYLNALSEYKPDLILSDHSLPQFDSIEALKLCRAVSLEIPFILVTGAVSDEFAVMCMKLGADDYILKSNLNRLPASIANALKHKEAEKAKLKAVGELASQNEELIKINKEVDSLVYSVSHNLRAPLMSMLGLVNLAKSESNPETLHQYHRMMEGAIHKLEDTLKEILDYSRNARQELRIEPVDFTKLINETLEKMRFMPDFDSLDVRVSVNEQIEFRSDLYRISVIFNNLISNGIKYLDKNRERSILKIEVVVDKERATIKFEDNGIGIDNALLPKVCDMFFRANTEKDGSGLGLYIVKEAVDKLKGKIEITSVHGQGTVFTLHIPNSSNP